MRSFGFLKAIDNPEGFGLLPLLKVRYQKGAKYTLEWLRVFLVWHGLWYCLYAVLHTNRGSLCSVTICYLKATYMVYSHKKQRQNLNYCS